MELLSKDDFRKKAEKEWTDSHKNIPKKNRISEFKQYANSAAFEENWKSYASACCQDEVNRQLLFTLQSFRLPDRQATKDRTAKLLVPVLQSDEIYAWLGGPGSYRRIRRDDPDLIYAFLMDIYVNGLRAIGVRYNGQILPVSFVLDDLVCQAVIQLTEEAYPLLKEEKRYMTNDFNVRETDAFILSRLRKRNIIRHISQDIMELYGDTSAVSIIARRKRYHFLLPYVKKEEENRRAILEAVPENVIDLYPLARDMERHFILHVGPTNSGKTYDAMQEMLQAESGIYLAPLRLLALEGQERVLSAGVVCSMATGEEEDIREGANHLCSTIEKLPLNTYYEIAIIDEAQMIDDPDRGWAWTQAILGVQSERIHVCMSADALHIVQKLIGLCGDTWEIIEHERNTPLIVEKHPFHFPNDVRKSDALIVFSRNKVLGLAAALEQSGIPVSVIYGSLPYDVRKNEVQKFLSGDTDVVVATDAIGMGMNLPIRRIVFMETEKFDGYHTRPLSPNEIRQIGGRAGRRGIFDEGYINTDGNLRYIREKIRIPAKDIVLARVGFPEILADLDMKLSEAILKWRDIKDQPDIIKADTETLLGLCLYLEANYGETMDKHMMYRFSIIPFNADMPKLLKLWKALILEYCIDGGKQVRIPEEDYSGCSLEALEAAYQEMDLYFSFAKVINSEILKKQSMSVKGTLARLIKNNLQTKQMTRCRICGRPLPWNVKGKLCRICKARREHTPAQKS